MSHPLRVEVKTSAHIGTDHHLCAAVVGGVVALLWTASQAASMAEGAQSGPGSEALSTQAAFRPRKDAVLVFGATGRLGTEVVSEV